MYEINKEWDKFYTLIDPASREKELNRLLSSEECPDEYRFAKEIFYLRFGGKKPDLSVDKFLFNCVLLISLSKGSLVFKNGLKKDAIKVLKDFGIESADTQIKKSLLYWEFRNTAKRYFETCKSSGYKKKLFGLMSSSDDEKSYHMMEDAWKMSVGAAAAVKMEEEFSLWTDAVKDEFSLCSLDARSEFEKFSLKKK